MIMGPKVFLGSIVISKVLSSLTNTYMGKKDALEGLVVKGPNIHVNFRITKGCLLLLL